MPYFWDPDHLLAWRSNNRGQTRSQNESASSNHLFSERFVQKCNKINLQASSDLQRCQNYHTASSITHRRLSSAWLVESRKSSELRDDHTWWTLLGSHSQSTSTLSAAQRKCLSEGIHTTLSWTHISVVLFSKKLLNEMLSHLQRVRYTVRLTSYNWFLLPTIMFNDKC